MELSSYQRIKEKKVLFAIIIDNCGETKLEEDGTRVINGQGRSLKEAFEGVGFCVLYFNSLSSESIARLLQSFRDNVDHSQLSAFALVFLSKGQTPQLYDANNEIIPFDAVLQFFYDDELPELLLAKIPKIFFFDVVCLDIENRNHPLLPQCPEKSVILAVSHHTPFSPAINTLSNDLSRKSIQDCCKDIHKSTGCYATWIDSIHDKFNFEKSSNEECLVFGSQLLLLRSLWYSIRSETVDVILRNKDEVMSIVRNERIARIAASSAGVVLGGGLVVLGLCLAPFTFGASIGVTVAGGIAGGLASAGGIGALIASKVSTNKRLKDAQEHINLDQQLSLTINEVDRRHQEIVQQHVNAVSFSETAGEIATGGAMGVADVGRVGTGIAIATEGIVESSSLLFRVGGRTIGMALAGVSLAVTVPLDIGSIAYHSYHIHKANQDNTGRTDDNQSIQWLIAQAEEMLKGGMCSEIKVNKHQIDGGNLDIIDKTEYGYKIHVPVSTVESSSITVRTIFSGPIVLPEGDYTLVSAFYDIKMPVLPEPVTITIEHCVDVSDPSIARKLCFATATFDIERKVLALTPVPNTAFSPGETYGSITQKESCFLCILYTGSLQDTSMKYATNMQQIDFQNFNITFSKYLNAHFKYTQAIGTSSVHRSLVPRPSRDYVHRLFYFNEACGSDAGLALKLSKFQKQFTVEGKGCKISPESDIPDTITKKEIDTVEFKPGVWKKHEEIFPCMSLCVTFEDNALEELNHTMALEGTNGNIVIKCKKEHK